MYAKWIEKDGRFQFSEVDNGGKEISASEHSALLQGQASGKIITANTEGFPELTDPPKATAAEVWQAIKVERERRKAGGVKVKVGPVNKWFHSDDASRIQQIGLVMMGTNIPAGLQWKTLDGSFVAITQTVAQNVFAAAAASDQAIFGVAEAHKAAVEACDDPSVYDYSTGWPKVYGE